MASTQHPLYNLVPSQSSKQVEIKANGTVSRMRSHKGNMPSLPQTKYCSLCPAKFTRTTHLNRHLRSHTNERLHRCNICQSQFTRSDLLTRHKRSCGDLLHTNRSRRKSCQACAESKIKCDLQYPCTKCSSRGRECIFINDPQASRNKKNAAAKKSVQQDANVTTFIPDSQSLKTPSSSALRFPERTPPAFSPIEPTPDFVSSSSTSMDRFTFVESRTPFCGSDFSQSSTSSAESSSIPSPRSEIGETYDESGYSLHTAPDALALNNHLSKIFQTEIFDQFVDNPYSSPASEGITSGTMMRDYMWMDSVEEQTEKIGDDTFSFSTQPIDVQPFISAYDFSQSVTPHPSPVELAEAGLPVETSPVEFTLSAAESSFASNNLPPAAELQHYLYLFFSAFLTQIPILHSPSWQLEGKPPVLIRAMQACGALFVKTRTAVNFITETLSFTRDVLIQEFARNPRDSTEQTNLILAVVLLQTVGLFHQRADQRVCSNIYHGMLVMMIRRTGLISRNASWAPPNLADASASSVDRAWKEWANYETTKRALLFSFIHDCCHSTFFGLPASFHPSEFDLGLPCENALWKAHNGNEWLEVLQNDSPYGTVQARLVGVGLQQALSTLGETRLPPVSLPLNPFSHFVLMHSILRDIFASSCRADNQQGECYSPSSSAASHDESAREAVKEQLFASQYALHNWMQSWVTGPESPRPEVAAEEPMFVNNALPFYWLAQVSVIAAQNNQPILLAKSEMRFRLIKSWLVQIRGYLKAGGVPVNLWDELMKINIQDLPGDGDVMDTQDGLLSFFPEH